MAVVLRMFLSVCAPGVGKVGSDGVIFPPVQPGCLFPTARVESLQTLLLPLASFLFIQFLVDYGSVMRWLGGTN